MFRLIFTFFLITLSSTVYANQTLKGTVYDTENEPLVGATVEIKDTPYYAIVGLDGSFNISKIPEGTYEVLVSYVGFKKYSEQIEVNSNTPRLNIIMEFDNQSLGEVIVQARTARGSDAQARLREKNAQNTMNVVSAKSMELSPDITVANVIQRVSGMSIERNSSGDAQYAIVRGMDKRYNYTLVNGVKIPSPDNKNRYVPLDIFPAQMLERLEVSKGLTADMEGDAIGGSVNLVMKSAPETFEVNADMQVGYNAIHFDRQFYTYDRSTEQRFSPAERFGSRYEATPDDFSKDNLIVSQINPLPDVFGGVTVGDRFFDGKLGVMLGGSLQNSYRSADRDWYKIDSDPVGTGRPALGNFQQRETSVNQFRLGLHSKLDYRFNEKNNVSLYLGRFVLNDFEVRESINSDRDQTGDNQNATFLFQTRVRSTYSNISNATLQGDHALFDDKFLIDWSALISRAEFDRPDNAIFQRNGGFVGGQEMTPNIERRNPRRWEKHFDQDYTLHLNFTYFPEFFPEDSYVKFGGMFRDKERGTLFNRYRFDPNPPIQNQGEDWDDFSDVQWELLNPRGTLSHALNYDAFERIAAFYFTTHFEISNVELNLGFRVESTDQGYISRTTNQFELPELRQQYVDVLPNFSFKYKPSDVHNVRGGYYKAINRPGYFEIVDGVSDEDDEFDFRGNPDLNRAKADNFDLRFEYFPNANEQFLLGGFFKRIEDPIELLLIRQTSLTTGPRNLTPTNSGTATNWGVEMDFSKFFNKIGIRGNYTFTNSSLTTQKTERIRENPEDPSSQIILNEVTQTRPLQGQADHVANFSLLYKNLESKTDIQLSAVYTGERIEIVSPWRDLDIWSRPFTQLDFSFEQGMGEGWTLFLKANNILNAPYELFVKSPRKTEQLSFPLQDVDGETIVQRDVYFQSFRIGARYSF